MLRLRKAGILRDEAKLPRLLHQQRFGAAPDSVEARLEAADEAQLKTLGGTRVFEAHAYRTSFGIPPEALTAMLLPAKTFFAPLSPHLHGQTEG